MDLFDRSDDTAPETDAGAPLAERIRPRRLEEILGQEDAIGPGTFLRRSIESDRLSSTILWGPPGSGKTTVARVIAATTRGEFVSYSAVLAGVAELRKVMRQASQLRRRTGRGTVLFLDEIHRFNRAQQDAFLPFVEGGDVVLLGATTENPSFEINAALLSRCRVVILRPLGRDSIVQLLRRALEDGRGLGGSRLEIDDSLLGSIADRSLGDVRVALGVLEGAAALASGSGEGRISGATVARAAGSAVLRHDKAGEEHFNLISALQKSIRNSDVDAALYWLARLLEAGEDALYVARRIVRIASEDVGLAEPNALALCVAARDAMHFLGHPEGDLALAQAVVFLAAAPKSNSLETAWAAVRADLAAGEVHPVPLHLRNAPTRAMRDQGYGVGYRYAHDEPEGVADMECLPPALGGRRYFRPGGRGEEAELDRRIREWSERRRRARSREEG